MNEKTDFPDINMNFKYVIYLKRFLQSPLEDFLINHF